MPDVIDIQLRVILVIIILNSLHEQMPPQEREPGAMGEHGEGESLSQDDCVLSPVGDISSESSHFMLLASL